MVISELSLFITRNKSLSAIFCKPLSVNLSAIDLYNFPPNAPTELRPAPKPAPIGTPFAPATNLFSISEEFSFPIASAPPIAPPTLAACPIAPSAVLALAAIPNIPSGKPPANSPTTDPIG